MPIVNNPKWRRVNVALWFRWCTSFIGRKLSIIVLYHFDGNTSVWLSYWRAFRTSVATRKQNRRARACTNAHATAHRTMSCVYKLSNRTNQSVIKNVIRTSQPTSTAMNMEINYKNPTSLWHFNSHYMVYGIVGLNELTFEAPRVSSSLLFRCNHFVYDGSFNTLVL